MAEKSAGLPMTSRWDPEKIRQEEVLLSELGRTPLLARIKGYWKFTGPGWLQSAMTLGAGSATASVMGGASFGYKLLWVQPIAMLLGVAMMAAVGNVVMSTGERPYRSFSRELHPSVAFLWALGTIVASVIWHFPQYGLVGASAWDLATMAGIGSGDSGTLPYVVKFIVGGGILTMAILLTWNYGSHARGLKFFEGFLRTTVRLVLFAFLIVVITTGIRWGELAKGLFAFQVPEVEGATTLVLGMVGAAVGINMTFLYPYSILAKGWGKHHKAIARFDLFNSMFLPYVIGTGLIIIAMGNTIYGGTDVLRSDLKPVQAAASLAGLPLLGAKGGRILFDLGLIGMACGAITTHMVVCGFTVNEMFGLEYTAKRYRMFTLVPAIGIFGVAFPSPFWFPIVASAICLTMLPIAYIAFFIMNNKRSYLKDAVGRGAARIAFNAVLLVAIVMATVGAALKLKSGVYDKIFPPKASAPAAPGAPGGGR